MYLEGVRIDAIVGLDLLSRTSFGIDYRLRRVTFAPAVRESEVAPLEIVWPFVTVRMTIEGQQVRLLVDTGSRDLVLFKTRMPAALSGAPWRGDKTVTYALRRSAAPAARAAKGRPWGRPVGHTAGLGIDRAPDGYPTGIDGVLGVLALGCQRVQFDFENGQFGWSR